jgi:Asp-tRNA(Asn)/Glu-tRNA(Gln) amidotransferase A subunit family amidase
LDVLKDFVDRLKHAGAEIIRDKVPEVDSGKHFNLYLKLLGAAMSSGFSEAEIEVLKDSVKAMNNDRVFRVCGARFEGLSLYHREWLDLDNQRSLHRQAFDAYFQKIDILITPATGSPAFVQKKPALLTVFDNKRAGLP